MCASLRSKVKSGVTLFPPEECDLSVKHMDADCTYPSVAILVNGLTLIVAQCFHVSNSVEERHNLCYSVFVEGVLFGYYPFLDKIYHMWIV